jgi:hypothetical protein
VQHDSMTLVAFTNRAGRHLATLALVVLL